MKLGLLFGFIFATTYTGTAILAQATNFSTNSILDVGILTAIVIAAMRFQRLEDRVNNLPCRRRDDGCSFLQKTIKKVFGNE